MLFSTYTKNTLNTVLIRYHSYKKVECTQIKSEYIFKYLDIIKKYLIIYTYPSCVGINT